MKVRVTKTYVIYQFQGQFHRLDQGVHEVPQPIGALLLGSGKAEKHSERSKEDPKPKHLEETIDKSANSSGEVK